MQFRKSGGAVGGGAAPPPPFANLPKMTLFSSLLPPKAISCGFSILYAGGNVFTHLFVLQRKRSFTVFCYLAFLLPSKYVWLSPSCLSVKTFGLEKTCLFMSSRLERAGGLRGGAQPPPPPICNEGAPSKRATKAISQGISFCVIVIVVIVRKQSVKAEPRRSREAQKLKSTRKAKAEESNQQEKTTSNPSREEQQAKVQKEKSEADNQRSRKAKKQEKRKSKEAEKQRSRKAEESKKKY